MEEIEEPIDISNDEFISLKEKGDKELKYGKYTSAIDYYLEALSQLKIYEEYNYYDINTKISTLKILSNLCNCFNKLKNFYSLLDYSSKGIKLYHSYVNKLPYIKSIPKLFAFRAIASANLKDFKMAEEDLIALQKFQEEKEEIKNLIIYVKSIIIEKKNEYDKINSGNKYENSKLSEKNLENVEDNKYIAPSQKGLSLIENEEEREKSESTSSEDDSFEEGKKYKFSKVKFITKTSFGKIFVVTIDKDEFQVKKILKKIKIKSDQEIDEIYKDIEKVKNINSKYAIKINDYYLQQKGDTKIINILFDYFEKQDLKSFIKEALSFDTRREILIKICFALKYFQLNCIILEYLHPENIFIDKEKNILFSGFNKTINFINKNTNDISLYKSPERQNKEKESIKSNMWTLGCILYELVFKEKAFYNIKDVNNINIKYEGYSNMVKLILNNLLCKEENRITINKPLNENIFKLLEKDLYGLYIEQDLFVYNTFIDDYLMKNFFSFFSFSCEKCGQIPEIILKDNKSILIICDKCGITENEVLENIAFYSSKWIKFNKLNEIKNKNSNNNIELKNFENEIINIEGEKDNDNDNDKDGNKINENDFIEFLKNIKINRDKKYNSFNETINCVKNININKKYKECIKIYNKIKDNLYTMYSNNMRMYNNLLIFSFILFMTYKNINNIGYDKIVQYKELFDLINKELIEKNNEFI